MEGSVVHELAYFVVLIRIFFIFLNQIDIIIRTLLSKFGDKLQQTLSVSCTYPWAHPKRHHREFQLSVPLYLRAFSGYMNKFVGKLDAQWKLMLRNDPQLKRENS